MVTMSKEYRQKYYLNNREKILTQNTQYNKQHPAQRKDSNKRYRESHPEKVAESNRNWRHKNPEKVRQITRKYIETNPVKRKVWNKVQHIPLGKKCEECGSTIDLQHHHPDYSKPFLMVTLCRRCHNKKRREVNKYGFS